MNNYKFRELTNDELRNVNGGDNGRQGIFAAIGIAIGWLICNT